MKIAQDPKLKSAINSAEKGCKILVESGKKELAEQLKIELERTRNEKFVVGVIGSAKRGKSTLINGLIERRDDNLAPIGKFPVTNVTSVFTWAQASSIKVLFMDGTDKEIVESEVRAYACEECNPNNHKNVRGIEAKGPFPGLEPGVYLADTPGANNALDAQHGEIMLNFLLHADALIFLIAADSPLVAAEQNILRAINGNDVRKVFFAVNKVDRIDSGDMDNDQLNEGIEHNRKILDDVGFPNAKLFCISAKNYFEKQSDDGTEQLLAYIRTMISNDRISIMIEHLVSRTKSILQQARKELVGELSDAKASEEDLISERKLLQTGKRNLQLGRDQRKKCFKDKWDKAFVELENQLLRIGKELNNEYAQLIDKTPMRAIPALAQTINADVITSFSERLQEAKHICEEKLAAAEKELTGSVQALLIKVKIDVEPAAPITSSLTDSFKILVSTVPSMFTGSVSAALPGIVASMITASAPTVAAATFNPLTWGPAFFTSVGATSVTAISATVTAALATIAIPVAVGSFGFAAYRAYATWKSLGAQGKNKLISSIQDMIDQGSEDAINQVRIFSKGSDFILEKFEETLNERLKETENRLSELIINRPSPNQIRLLENGVTNVEQHLKLLDSTDQSNCIVDNNATDMLFHQ